MHEQPSRQACGGMDQPFFQSTAAMKYGWLMGLILLAHGGFAQHNLRDSTYSTGKTVRNPFGEFAYQYNRIIAPDSAHPRQMVVTFVFINGNSTMAIQYRQEALEGAVEWIDTEGGRVKKEKFVEVVTATVPSNHILSWKYRFIPGKGSRGLDKAALLLMDDNMKVEKEIFPPLEWIGK